MPIREYLDGLKFDPETIRLMGIALEMAMVALRHTDGVDPPRDPVARKIIELAKAGERDLERLCEGALRDLQPIIDPSPPLPPASPQELAGSCLSQSGERPDL
jgi:hypothetical protein